MIRLVYLFLLLPLISIAQKMPETVSNNRVILNQRDSVIYAYLLPVGEDENIRANNDYFYWWYASHDIKQTQGGFDGRLLDGVYTEFYEGKELKTKGMFHKGLRKGTWKTWHRNGSLSSIILYSKSLKNGKFTEYYESGRLYRKGKYKENKLHGTVKVYGENRDLVIAKEKYKYGYLAVEKEKKGRIKKDEKVLDSVKAEGKPRVKKEKKKKGTNTTDNSIIVPAPVNPAPADGTDPSDKKEKKKKKEKDPQIKIRRGIRLYPQPGKST